MQRLLDDRGICVDALWDDIDPESSLLRDENPMAVRFRSDSTGPEDIILPGIQADVRKQDLLRLQGLERGPASQLNDSVVNGVLEQIVADREPRQPLRPLLLDSSAWVAIAACMDDPSEVLDTHLQAMCGRLDRPDLPAKRGNQAAAFEAWGLQHALQAHRLIIPIFHSELQHWSLGVIDMQAATVQHIDSCHDDGRHDACERELMRWVSSELFQQHCPEKAWQRAAREPAAQQHNSDDCGVFTILFAASKIAGVPVIKQLSFEQVFMARQWLMAYLAADYAMDEFRGDAGMLGDANAALDASRAGARE